MIGGSEVTYKEKNGEWIELDLLKGTRSPREQCKWIQLGEAEIRGGAECHGKFLQKALRGTWESENPILQTKKEADQKDIR